MPDRTSIPITHEEGQIIDRILAKSPRLNMLSRKAFVESITAAINEKIGLLTEPQKKEFLSGLTIPRTPTPGSNVSGESVSNFESFLDSQTARTLGVFRNGDLVRPALRDILSSLDKQYGIIADIMQVNEDDILRHYHKLLDQR